jgi:predicted GNAT family N-acyltransferase
MNPLVSEDAARKFAIRLADWTEDFKALRAVREEVFIREQAVPVELEWDNFDAVCLHALAFYGNEAIGTGRLLPDGYIGRMAVVPSWRGRGVGCAILDILVEQARRRGLGQVVLNAQVQAVPFYERSGFMREGGVFADAGIPHVRMRRAL